MPKSVIATTTFAGAHIPTRYVYSQYPKPARRNPIPTKRPQGLSAGGVPEALSVQPNTRTDTSTR